MSGDLIYIVHPDSGIAATLRDGLRSADYNVVSMSSVDEARSVTSKHQFTLPDAILTPLGGPGGGDSVLVTLFESNPLMEQIPLVVVANQDTKDSSCALRMGLLSVVFPPYDVEDVALTTKAAVEKHRSDQIFFGSVEQLTVPDLLQIAEVGRRTGTISFHRNGLTGTVWLREGLVIDAELGEEHRGEEAVYAIAVWSTGTFAADFGDIEIEERFRTPPSTLLLEAMRRFDEESANGIIVPPLQTPSPDSDYAVVDLSLVVLNVVGSYAINHLHPPLIQQRFEETRKKIEDEYPVLGLFNVTDEGVVTVLEANLDGFDDEQAVRGVSLWVKAIFERLDTALAWRFSPNRLARLLAPWVKQLDECGFSEILGIEEGESGDEDEGLAHDSSVDIPVPVGCLVLDSQGGVQNLSIYGPRVGQADQAMVIGKALREILPPDIGSLLDRLTDRLESGGRDLEGVAIGREVLLCGHQEFLVRLAVVELPFDDGTIVTINRLRDQRRSLSPDIERDPLTGSLRDGKADRLIVVNEDFLQAFEGLFARSLAHRHHELLQRFGKKWGLRHAMRLEQVVQRDYRKTLRELESQMALEMLSSSLGVIGLGSFEADLGYRDAGLLIIRHSASPFPSVFAATAGGACPILSGFHAAILSYLSGRQLAAREVHCSHEPGERCLFVVATEERLSKLLIATPGSPDHDLLAEIVRAKAPGAD
jgi:DNA-binding response OmpR family regulator/predicted hydrocarbon binding protein